MTLRKKYEAFFEERVKKYRQIAWSLLPRIAVLLCLVWVFWVPWPGANTGFENLDIPPRFSGQLESVSGGEVIWLHEPGVKNVLGWAIDFLSMPALLAVNVGWLILALLRRFRTMALVIGAARLVLGAKYSMVDRTGLRFIPVHSISPEQVAMLESVEPEDEQKANYVLAQLAYLNNEPEQAKVRSDVIGNRLDHSTQASSYRLNVIREWIKAKGYAPDENARGYSLRPFSLQIRRLISRVALLAAVLIALASIGAMLVSILMERRSARVSALIMARQT